MTKKGGKTSNKKNGEFEEVTDEGNTDEDYFSPTEGEDSEGRIKP
jgi:hypothetical protein